MLNAMANLGASDLGHAIAATASSGKCRSAPRGFSAFPLIDIRRPRTDLVYR